MRLPLLVAGLSVAFAGCGLIDSVSGPKSLSIQKFEAAPEDVASGASVTLTWDVDGSEAVAINNGIGAVPRRGSRTFPAYYTSTYTISARAGTSTATATVQVNVRGSGTDPFAPFPSPTPSPEPFPTPSPEPTPPADADCGAPAEGNTEGCLVTRGYPVELPDGQCIELNVMTVDEACPVNYGTTLAVAFRITAKTALESLTWRVREGEADTLTPTQGPIDVNGTTDVQVKDVTGGDSVVLEVVDEKDQARLSFRLTHR